MKANRSTRRNEWVFMLQVTSVHPPGFELGTSRYCCFAAKMGMAYLVGLVASLTLVSSHRMATVV